HLLSFPTRRSSDLHTRGFPSVSRPQPVGQSQPDRLHSLVELCSWRGDGGLGIPDCERTQRSADRSGWSCFHWCSPDRAGSREALRRAAIGSRCVGSHSGETGPIQNWIRSPGVRGRSGKLIPRKGVPTMTSAEKPSLYERLGGVYSIATVVDDLIDRVMVDPRLNANPLVDEAHHRVPPAGFKYLVTEMVCWASGGPQKYTGKPMADSHAHLKITGQEWEAFMDDFQQTLDKFEVPAEEQAELKAIVDSTRSDIVIDSALRAVS